MIDRSGSLSGMLRLIFFVALPGVAASVARCPVGTYQKHMLVLNCAGGEIDEILHLKEGEVHKIGTIPEVAHNVTVRITADGDMDLHLRQNGRCIIGYGCDHATPCADGVFCHEINGQHFYFSGDDSTSNNATDNHVLEEARIKNLNSDIEVNVVGYKSCNGKLHATYNSIDPCPALRPGCAHCSEYLLCGQGQSPVCDGTRKVTCSTNPDQEVPEMAPVTVAPGYAQGTGAGTETAPTQGPEAVVAQPHPADSGAEAQSEESPAVEAPAAAPEDSESGSWSLPLPPVLLNIILIPLVCGICTGIFCHFFHADDDEVKDAKIPLFERHQQMQTNPGTSERDIQKSKISRLNQQYFCAAKIHKMAQGLVQVEYDAKGDNSAGEVPPPTNALLFINSFKYNAKENVEQRIVSDQFQNLQGMLEFYPDRTKPIDGALIEFQYQPSWSRVTLQVRSERGSVMTDANNWVLSVTIQRASNVPKLVMGVQDPYVALYLTRAKIEDWHDAPVKPKEPFGKTKNSSNPTDPLWNETFQMSLDPDSISDRKAMLYFLLFDAPTGTVSTMMNTQTFLGHAAIDPFEFQNKKDEYFALPITDHDPRKRFFNFKTKTKDCGTLHVECSWVKS